MNHRQRAMQPAPATNRYQRRLYAAWRFVQEAVRASRDNKVLRMAAALAYYAMFALAPLLIIVVAGARLALGDATAEAAITSQLAAFVGETGASALTTLVNSLEPTRADLHTTLIGGGGLVFAAATLFNHLRDSLNTIWEVTPYPERHWWRSMLDWLMAVLMVPCVGVIALLGLASSISLAGWAELLTSDLPVPAWFAARSVQVCIAVLVITLLVALIYRVLPNSRVAWRDVWLGAFATAVLIVLSQALIGLYLRSSRFESAYSAIGAVVIVLIWVYCSAVVFFFGAELTWVYANRYGSRIEPGEDALSLAAGDRAAQGLLRAHEIAAASEQEAKRERALGDESANL
jgi:membrane protein